MNAHCISTLCINPESLILGGLLGFIFASAIFLAVDRSVMRRVRGGE
jgi:hypothetical protein